MENILPFLFWAGIILYAIYANNKKQNTKPPKVIVEGKKPQAFEKAFDFEKLLQETIDMEAQAKSQELPSREKKSVEYTIRERINQEAKVKPVKEEKPTKEALPSIKATKPPKPSKPSKNEEFEEYAQHEAKPNPLKTFLEGEGNLRNAFILSEIFKRRF